MDLDWAVTKTTNIIEQIAIKAQTPQEAVDKVKKGEGDAITHDTNERYAATLRPIPPQRSSPSSIHPTMIPGMRPPPGMLPPPGQ